MIGAETARAVTNAVNPAAGMIAPVLTVRTRVPVTARVRAVSSIGSKIARTGTVRNVAAVTGSASGKPATVAVPGMTAGDLGIAVMTVAGTVVMIAVPTMAAAMTAVEIVETTGVTTAPVTAGMSVAMIAVAVRMVDAVRDTAVATAGRTGAGMIAPGEIAMIVGRTEIVTTTDAMTAEAGLTTAVPTMTVVVAPMHARTSAGMIVVTTAVQPVGVVMTAAGIAVMSVAMTVVAVPTDGRTSAGTTVPVGAAMIGVGATSVAMTAAGMLTAKSG